MRKTGGPSYPEMIEEMERELTKYIEDFDPGIKALHMVNETSKLSFAQSVDS